MAVIFLSSRRRREGRMVCGGAASRQRFRTIMNEGMLQWPTLRPDSVITKALHHYNISRYHTSHPAEVWGAAVKPGPRQSLAGAGRGPGCTAQSLEGAGLWTSTFRTDRLGFVVLGFPLALRGTGHSADCVNSKLWACEIGLPERNIEVTTFMATRQRHRQSL